MPLKIPIVTELPAQKFQIVLDGVQYTLRLTWKDRTASWYLDVYGPQGESIALGRRLSAGYAPLAGAVTNGPPGLLAVTGTEPASRHETQLFYFQVDELPAAALSGLVVELD
ncbi:MAG: hypothetical protein HOP09_14680 [Hyphomicrobium sp.]|nr:hypothetical protein [Hyphomicrobium sp.]